METISFSAFNKVDIRVGKIVSAEQLEGARKPAYKLIVDFGPEIGLKTSSAQITALYTPANLTGKLVVGVINFPPKQIGHFISECLISGFYNNEGAVVLCAPDGDVPIGSKLC